MSEKLELIVPLIVMVLPILICTIDFLSKKISEKRNDYSYIILKKPRQEYEIATTDTDSKICKVKFTEEDCFVDLDYPDWYFINSKNKITDWDGMRVVDNIRISKKDDITFSCVGQVSGILAGYKGYSRSLSVNSEFNSKYYEIYNPATEQKLFLNQFEIILLMLAHRRPEEEAEIERIKKAEQLAAELKEINAKEIIKQKYLDENIGDIQDVQAIQKETERFVVEHDKRMMELVNQIKKGNE